MTTDPRMRDFDRSLIFRYHQIKYKFVIIYLADKEPVGRRRGQAPPLREEASRPPPPRVATSLAVVEGSHTDTATGTASQK